MNMNVITTRPFIWKIQCYLTMKSDLDRNLYEAISIA
jgi:hypothetical protein